MRKYCVEFISGAGVFIRQPVIALGIFLRKPARKLARALPCAALIAITALTTIPNRSAIAAEGGSGFYLLGQRGQGAAVLPTAVEGALLAV